MLQFKVMRRPIRLRTAIDGLICQGVSLAGMFAAHVRQARSTISAPKSCTFWPQPTVRYAPFFAPDPEVVRNALQPGDILLVEGNTRLSAIIKFLTQSTWSHAALYVGERPGDVAPDGEPNVLLEAEADTGVITVPLSKYVHFNTRICRPVGLDDAEQADRSSTTRWRASASSTTRKQIVDLARYLFPYPPVPVWFRRRMLSIGSGDPTKAICSTLIARGVRIDPLSDPAGKRLDQRQDLRHRALCAERDRPHPQARPLHAARLRRVAVFRDRQADAGRRLRLSHRAMGPAGGFSGGFAARRDRARTVTQQFAARADRQHAACSANMTHGGTSSAFPPAFRAPQLFAIGVL